MNFSIFPSESEMANSNMALTFYRKRYIFYSFSSVLSTFVPLPTISERGICRSWHQFVEQTAWRILDHDPDFSRWPIDSRSTLRFISRVESKHSPTGTGCVCVCFAFGKIVPIFRKYLSTTILSVYLFSIRLYSYPISPLLRFASKFFLYKTIFFFFFFFYVFFF